MTFDKNLKDVRLLANNLKLLLLDVDGVLTDGGIFLLGDTEEMKRFDVKDGIGISLARAVGIRVGIITSRSSVVVERRARELNIDDLYQGVGVKTDVLYEILKKYDLDPSEAGYVGDDIQDIPIMKMVGLPIAVGDARREVKECSKYVVPASGGHGAVRDIVEWILELRGDSEKAYTKLFDDS